ncbi:MAG: peroxide stress protein YaaA [Paracoccaceae bacterium]
MLVVISPAKKMDMDTVEGIETTKPVFAARAKELAGVARALDAPALQKLMHISENLAALNAERFAKFGKMEKKAAALAFAGDTYQGLEAGTLDADEMRYAQDHLRILSGLYGVLRPLDAIEPYRLEMGSRLATEKGKNLYDYWGDTIAKALNKKAKETGSDTLVNCASQEYFGAVDLKALKPQVITPVFMEEKAGKAKIVSFFAKKARGAMARYIVQNRITDAQGLKAFDLGGYRYRTDMSEGDKWVFLRDYPEA